MGEQLAESFLLDKGYQMIEKNWRCKLGEIDLIAKMDQTIIFVEVKTRTSVRYGYPVEAVDQRKQLKIRRVAEWYLLKNHLIKMHTRFDVITVQFSNTSTKPMFEHYEGAF